MPTTIRGAVVGRASWRKPSRALRSILIIFACNLLVACGDSSTILDVDDGSIDWSAVDIGIVGGDDQASEVGSALSSSLQVRVIDGDDQPLVGAGVMWTFTDGRGRRSPAEAAVDTVLVATDAQGNASVQWVLGTSAGTQNAMADILVPPPPGGTLPTKGRGVLFSADALPGAATTIAVTPGDVTIAPNQTLDFDAESIDQYGNVVATTGFVWSTTDSQVIDVDSQGLVTAMSSGSADVVAASGSLSGDAHVDVNTGAPTAPTVTTSVLAQGTVGTSYSRTLSASGGDGTYTWSVTSGSLPSGLSLSSAGTISGTPTAVGVSTFTVQVQSAGLTGTRVLAITIVTATPPPPGGYRRNMPAGLTVLSDYGFDDDLPPHSGSYDGPLGGGWNAVDWACTGCAIRRMADASSPDGSGYVLEEVYPPHLSGGGPSSFYRSVNPTNTFYMSWIVKWEAGFDHNSNSEKMVYFNPNASNYFLFQFHWGSEAMYHVTQADGDGSLRANLMPTDGTGWHLAPPVDGLWVEYEFLFEQSTGRIRWWRDGVLHADHTGRSFPTVDRVKVSTTWGGGGDKQGTHSRYTDHIFIAGN